MDEPPQVKAGVFAVRKEDWERFLEMMEDSANNFSTWETWKISLQQSKLDLFNEGIDAVEVSVDLDDFEEWCVREGQPLIGPSRAKYAAEILRRQDT